MSDTITPGRKVATPQEVTQAGDWCVEQSGYDSARGVAAFYYIAPDGVLNSSGGPDFPAYDHIYIRTGEKQSGYWQWDGNVDAPTIAPSIFHKGASSWHGFFEAGNWRTL